MRYAQNLTMVRFADGILVELKDPWHEGRILHRYWLTEDSNSKRSSLHTSLSSLLSPLSSLKLLSTLLYYRASDLRCGCDIWRMGC